MCLLCIEIAKGNMTGKEIVHALSEQSNMEENHASDMLRIIKESGRSKEVDEAMEDILKDSENYCAEEDFPVQFLPDFYD